MLVGRPKVESSRHICVTTCDLRLKFAASF